MTARRISPHLRLAAALSLIPLILFLIVTSGWNDGELPVVSDAPSSPIELSVVIPSYHEAPNITPLVNRIFKTVDPRTSEVIIVDDNSQDGTVEAAEKLKEEGYNVVLVVRTNVSGLSSAVLRGFAHARGSKFVVMDADLQHPPESLPAFSAALTRDTPFAMGTRYGAGGGVDRDWPAYRRLMSWGARMLARPLSSASDPMTGFFGLTRSLYASAARVNPVGFKIALELLLKTGVARDEIAEVPYGFAKRTVGESKLSSKVILKYVGHLAALYRWRIGWFGLIVLEVLLIAALWAALHFAAIWWPWWRRRQRLTLSQREKSRLDV